MSNEVKDLEVNESSGSPTKDSDPKFTAVNVTGTASSGPEPTTTSTSTSIFGDGPHPNPQPAASPIPPTVKAPSSIATASVVVNTKPRPPSLVPPTAAPHTPTTAPRTRTPDASARDNSPQLGSPGGSVTGKRKRSDENDRAVSPTTQTQHHHLAAHEAARGGEPQSSRSPSERPAGDEAMTAAGEGEQSPDKATPKPNGDGSSVDPKRRKRVFSNRTKTGCITCRRRKKKCDEGKPECSNCRRGGFVCEGYSGKVNWTKPQGKGMQSPATTQMSPHVPQSAPLVSPGHPSEPVYVAGVISAIEKPQNVTPNYGNSSMVDQAYSVPPTPSIQSAPDVQRTLSFSHAAHATAPGSSINPRPRSEKDKMINSELYHARAPELVAEREMCKAACWRFNHVASNPNLNVSEAEKGRLLLDILRPGRNWDVVNTGGAAGSCTYVTDQGYSSDIIDVNVEAPFTCSYGYNIRLGKNVFIEFGCTILDSCTVTIKARTILSPGVNIYSATHPIDPRKRNGARGPEMAKPVLIEEDCWLGGNVTVLGGITIGKGSVVGAGSVVTRDVPPFTVVAGNPARVIRGIYQNGIDM